MNKVLTSILIVCLFGCINNDNKEKTITDIKSKIEDLIPDNLTLHYKKVADLNLDSISDLIIVCEFNDSTAINKPVLVYFGLKDGSYDFKGRNDRLAFDNFSGVEVTRNYFTIENRIGTNVTYSNYNHTFKVVNNEIVFHRYDEAVYEVLDSKKGPELNDMITKRAKDLGFPTFEGYNN